MKNHNVYSLSTFYPPKLQYKDHFSDCIMKLKKCDSFAIMFLATRLQNWIAENTTGKYLVCSVPSHEPCKTNGITYIAQRICYANDNLTDGTSLVRRWTSVRSFGINGHRRRSVIDASISVSDKVKNKHILLLDDVVSTGTSLAVVSNKLLMAGAYSVTCVTLGETYKQNYPVKNYCCA
jgi:predicted amidophosphoribosyltransferase